MDQVQHLQLVAWGENKKQHKATFWVSVIIPNGEN